VPTVVSFVNLKGGVGKTTLAVNFAAFCGLQGKKTLLIDLDPQTNATFSCISPKDWGKHANKHGTVADLLGVKNANNAEGKKKTATQVLLKNVRANVDLIPSHIDLFLIDLELGGATSRETKLRQALKTILDDYEVIVCDCPPNLTIPTQNALAMSTHYVVPISPDFLSSLGVALLISRVKKMGEDLERDLELAGIVISRCGRPAIKREQTKASLRKEFKKLVLPGELTERIAVASAAQDNVSVFETGDVAAKLEFTSMCKAIAKKVGI
jgi:chromosome partitioning protein